ncbi:MAG: 50S ribosomal protein L18 [Candidatus Omnitrophota bacterium]
MQKKNIKARKRRHSRIRKKVIGSEQRPRLCIHRSLSNFSAQIIDDLNSKTICSVGTFNKKLRSDISYGGNLKAAEALGKAMAEEAKAKGLEEVVFDRGGYSYHGRVKAFAEAARKEGLKF